MRRIAAIISAILAAATSVLVGWQAAVASPVSHIPTSIAPRIAAWYDVSRATAAAPAAPLPGVGKGDLVVQGLTIDTGDLPVALPSTPPIRIVTAFTALSFKLPKGASAGSLTLKLTGLSTAKLDSHLPSGASPIACPTTTSFKAGDEQPNSAAPKYNCSKAEVAGEASSDDGSIEFEGISRLARGTNLSFVILPGSLGTDRLVFAPPAKKTLGLLDFSTPGGGGSIPPVTTPSTGTTSPNAAPTTTTIAPVDPSAPGGVNAIPPPVGMDTTAPSVSAPDVAPSTQPSSGSSPQPIALRAQTAPFDTKRERVAAVGLLIALLAIAAWLAVTDRRTPTVWGIGRFASQRDGTPPSI